MSIYCIKYISACSSFLKFLTTQKFIHYFFIVNKSNGNKKLGIIGDICWLIDLNCKHIAFLMAAITFSSISLDISAIRLLVVSSLLCLLGISLQNWNDKRYFELHLSNCPRKCLIINFTLRYWKSYLGIFCVVHCWTMRHHNWFVVAPRLKNTVLNQLSMHVCI